MPPPPGPGGGPDLDPFGCFPCDFISACFSLITCRCYMRVLNMKFATAICEKDHLRVKLVSTIIRVLYMNFVTVWNDLRVLLTSTICDSLGINLYLLVFFNTLL